MAIGAFVVSLVIEFIVLCCRHCARRVPANYFLLLVFTVCQSLLFTWICAHFAVESVLTPAVMTSIITVGLTIYACITSTDITMRHSLFFLMSTSTICLMIVSTYLTFDSWWYPSLSAACVVVWGLFLVFDTQLMASGKSHSLSYDDFILGALLVYID